MPDGKGSNYMCDLQVGEVVTGSGPYGSMQLRDRNKDLIFIAGGSGMVSPGNRYFANNSRVLKNFSVVHPASLIGAS